MQLIPFQVDEDRFNVFVVIEDENWQRMQAFDPAQFALAKLPEEWQRLKLDTVIIGYASERDLLHVRALINFSTGPTRAATTTTYRST